MPPNKLFGGFNPIYKMENLMVGFILLITAITLIMSLIDIYKYEKFSNQAKLNLTVFIFFFPLLGPVLYFSFFKRKYTKKFPLKRF